MKNITNKNTLEGSLHSEVWYNMDYSVVQHEYFLNLLLPDELGFKGLAMEVNDLHYLNIPLKHYLCNSLMKYN